MTTSKTGYRGRLRAAARRACSSRRSRIRGPRALDEGESVERALTALAPLLLAQTAPGRDRGDGDRAGARRGRVHPGAGGVPARGRAICAASTASCSSPTRCRPGFAPHRHDVRGRARRRRARRRSSWPRASRRDSRSRRSARPAELMARWPKGSHGGTYGGNPIGCAAALATIDVLTEPGLPRRRSTRGASSCAPGCATIVADHGSSPTCAAPG